MKGGFTILLMVVGTIWASVAFSGDTASLPAYKTGDTWRLAYESQGRSVDSSEVLSNGTYELVYGENGEILVYAVDGGKRELYASLDELRQALSRIGLTAEIHEKFEVLFRADKVIK